MGDPDGVLAGVRRVFTAAHIAAVNVESPLTLRQHASANPNALEASPDSAAVLAAAGFDVVAIANNHAGDAGADSVVDTLRAVMAAGMAPVGGGVEIGAAWSPTIVSANGVKVAFLAIDASRHGLPASPTTPGIASWDPSLAHQAVLRAEALADVVIVGLHGGIEYHDGTDPLLRPLAEQLAEWGVDVVWGHGPHVGQPITVMDPDGDDRRTVVATSLGNLLFDQQGPMTGVGLILEVVVGTDGVLAHRVGSTRNTDMRIRFDGWVAPEGDVGFIDGAWWAIDRPVAVRGTSVEPFAFAEGTVTAAARGDLDGDGRPETLIAYRHPAREKSSDPREMPLIDRQGRTAHIGVLDEEGVPIWLSRRPPHAVGAVEACDGAAVFEYTSLDDGAVIAAGAGAWSGFGFIVAPELPGSASIGCADVDRNGTLEPVVVDRQSADAQNETESLFGEP
jgi:hypothetical protein